MTRGWQSAKWCKGAVTAPQRAYLGEAHDEVVILWNNAHIWRISRGKGS